MKKTIVIPFILIGLLLTLSFPELLVVEGEQANRSYFLKSTWRYYNPTSTQFWNLTQDEGDRTISLFMNNTWQNVELVNSTLPIEMVKNDEDGNLGAILSFPKPMLNPGEGLEFSVWYHIVAMPREIPAITQTASLEVKDIPQGLVNEYTQMEGPWQTDNPTLVSLANSLKGNETNVLTIIKNFVTWINGHITYPSQEARHETPYYPIETYTNAEGDCDDQAMLLVTLCRIVGIPSYLQVGGIYLPNKFDDVTIWEKHVFIVERAIGWHGWALVYIPPWGWLPVDLTYVHGNTKADPLSSIMSGAVTEQDTFQYMNITHTDYVASSIEDRTFIVNNGFQVYMEDEMTLDLQQNNDKTPSNPLTISIDLWIPIALIALTTLGFFTAFFLSKHLRKRNSEEM